jgi:hypothetical protein
MKNAPGLNILLAAPVGWKLTRSHCNVMTSAVATPWTHWRIKRHGWILVVVACSQDTSNIELIVLRTHASKSRILPHINVVVGVILAFC